MIKVSKGKDTKNHLIAGLIDKDCNLYLMDSKKKNVVKTKLSKVNRMYEYVSGL